MKTSEHHATATDGARIAPGMAARGAGQIVNVSGTTACSGPASLEQVPLCHAVYAAPLAHSVALSQTLNAERARNDIHVHALCPGVVATGFHERQGLEKASRSWCPLTPIPYTTAVGAAIPNTDRETAVSRRSHQGDHDRRGSFRLAAELTTQGPGENPVRPF
ncbi:SDR family NAD(P)-dependent oxidoreductase [Streptomyces bobili]|uniref:SDR family NAD(P)-dependent oxidoreductase n=1 Tax=Streptomyces bobili TaxID=67280 RepID=UPI00339FF897